MTNEGERDTVAWVEQHQAAYAYAYDKKGSLMRYFGVKGIPHAVLVDANGTIVWRGHPGSLEPSIIEKALVGALEKPVWGWPDETKKARQYLAKRQYAKALEEARKVEGPYADLITARITAKVTAVERAAQAGDYLAATEKGEAALDELKGLPETEKIEAILADIKAKPEAKHIIKGQKKLADLKEEIAGIGGSKRKAEKLLKELEELADDYEGTIVATQVADEISALRERI